MVLEQVTLSTKRAKSFFPASLQDTVQGVFLLSLQIGGITILQDRNRSLNGRLRLLGKYAAHAERLLAAGQGEKIDELNAEILSMESLMLNNVDSFPKAEYFQFLFPLLDVLYGTGIVLYSDQQTDYVPYVLSAFAIGTGPKPIAELIRRYHENYARYQHFVLEPYGHVLENYLVQEYFNNLYPCRIRGSVQHNYEIFLVFYKFLELFLIALAGVKRENLTIDDILALVGRMAQRTDHASVFLKAVEYRLQEMEWPTEKLMDVLFGDG